jgi:hypothetical protein
VHTDSRPRSSKSSATGSALQSPRPNSAREARASVASATGSVLQSPRPNSARAATASGGSAKPSSASCLSANFSSVPLSASAASRARHSDKNVLAYNDNYADVFRIVYGGGAPPGSIYHK